MPKATGQRKSNRLPQTESPDAAQAFADYVGLGPGRTLEALAEMYQARTEPVPTRQLSRLKIWSTAFGWQARLTAARNEATERKLEEAAELDADTFRETSVLLNERVKYTTRHHLDEIVKMRESVRKPTPKGGTSVNVSVSVEVERVVDRIAEEEGLTEDEKRELLARLSSRVAERR